MKAVRKWSDGGWRSAAMVHVVGLCVSSSSGLYTLTKSVYKPEDEETHRQGYTDTRGGQQAGVLGSWGSRVVG